MMTPKQTDETATARRRKEQVFTAAADCVRREGFHRTSMSQISAAAGMSPGHIYHYFDNKEGIITGIVACQYSELGQLIEDLKHTTRQSDAISAIVAHTPKSAARHMDVGNAALTMEILAEAARNPTVAALIQQRDKEVSKSFRDLLGGNSPEVESRCEIVAALLEGLGARVLRNPELGTALDLEMLQRVVRYVLTG